jgi:hypothetical protein
VVSSFGLGAATDSLTIAAAATPATAAPALLAGRARSLRRRAWRRCGDQNGAPNVVQVTTHWPGPAGCRARNSPRSGAPLTTSERVRSIPAAVTQARRLGQPTLTSEIN